GAPTVMGMGSAPPPPAQVFSSAPPPSSAPPSYSPPAPSFSPPPPTPSFATARPASVPPPAFAAGPAPMPAPATYAAAAVSAEVEELGTRSIEVTAMIGEEVQDVEFFSDPQSGKPRGSTMGLLASGAVAVVIALGVFFSTLVKEANAKAAFESCMNGG